MSAPKPTGPGVEVLPAMAKAKEALDFHLAVSGHTDALYVMVVLVPGASKVLGMDVVRMVSNMDVSDANRFIEHLAESTRMLKALAAVPPGATVN